IALSGVACTSGVTPRQLVQSSSENDKKLIWNRCAINDRLRDGRARQFQALKATENEPQNIFSCSTFPLAAQHLS
ncbi:hypothetical protein N0626_32680, partial [Pseudomonas aeruginosa]|uniref:hypothetical protein n=1 Tax=Pseudomonas aeruginosa TaxID=287 RepID=UPI002A43C6D0|nr:hypothetical protein [Pseudomonas aeruginosa]MCT0549149.1 hypothetical protein [Pseudomonas aeruginosa]